MLSLLMSSHAPCRSTKASADDTSLLRYAGSALYQRHQNYQAKYNEQCHTIFDWGFDAQVQKKNDDKQDFGLLQDGLWWLPVSGGAADRLRQVLVPAAGLGALAGLEGRVLLPAFGSYLALPAPWSTLLVTGALFGSAGMGLVLHEGKACCGFKSLKA